MARIRADYVFGTTTAALAATDTTLASAELARLPAVVGSDTAAITLHDSATGVYEIVHVTASAAGATSRPILRAREGSTARAWASGATWLHGATASDFAPASLSTVLVYRSTDLSLTSDTVTAVPWNLEVWDTDGFHDTTTNTSRITIPAGKAGKYLLQGSAQYNSSSGMIQCRFHKNGVLITPNGVGSTIAASGGIAVSHNAIVNLAVGDYVELHAYQFSGSTASLVSTLSSFAATLIGQ